MRFTEIKIIKAQSGKTVGRASVLFEDFWLSGFKIIQDTEKKKEYVTPPSYHSINGWRPLFRTVEKQYWQELQEAILHKFNEFQIEESMSEQDKTLLEGK